MKKDILKDRVNLLLPHLNQPLTFRDLCSVLNLDSSLIGSSSRGSILKELYSLAEYNIIKEKGRHPKYIIKTIREIPLKENHCTYEFFDDYGICRDKKGRFFYFDTEDYEKIKKYNIIAKPSGYFYFLFENGKTINIHKFLMGCPDDKVVHHINFKRNDNRKSNLIIMDRDEHMKLHAKFIKDNPQYISEYHEVDKAQSKNKKKKREDGVCVIDGYEEFGKFESISQAKKFISSLRSKIKIVKE